MMSEVYRSKSKVSHPLPLLSLSTIMSAYHSQLIVLRPGRHPSSWSPSLILSISYRLAHPMTQPDRANHSHDHLI